ncbi:hypothetical protein ACLQ2Q_17805 [Microbacterium sp. DT81.1]|uniref:hypothetical protein n=1 Tax=Microbacterium sp. DT81.1 TaxID=3393413 RepID=UPI003CEBC965
MRISTYQKRWLTAYGVATALSLYLLVAAALSPPFDGALLVPTGLGALAAVLGLLMATRLARRTIPDERFDAATAGMRTVAVAWLLFAATLVVLAVTETRFGATAEIDPSIAVEATSSFVGTIFGAAALVLIIDNGYTDYRKEMAEIKARPTYARRAR